MKGEAKRDYPASIHYQSPWWQDYAFVEDHFARINTAMTRGSAEVRLGVIHPVESYWLHFGPAEQTAGIRSQMDRNFRDLTQWLLCGSIDFDFISESLLPEQCPVGGAPLRVGKMAYDTVIVPGCETLRGSTLERLEAFAAAGGRLIFLGSAPRYENAVPGTRGEALWQRALRTEFSEEAVLAAVEPVRTVDIRDAKGRRTENLIHQLRRDGDDRWLFIAHSREPYHRDIPQCQDIRITLTGCWDVLEYDTQTGQIRGVEAETVGGKTVVRARLYDLDSLLLRYVRPGGAKPEAAASERDPAALPVPRRVAYTLDEPNVYLLDKAEFSLDGEPYRPEQELLRADDTLRQHLGWPDRSKAVAQPWTIHEPKPEHTVRLRFRVVCAEDIPAVKLALEDAEIARITCNGSTVTAKPDGWFTDKSIGTVPLGNLSKGENTIEVALPFGRRTNIEWCYLLGSFGVEVSGEYRELTPMRSLLGFDDVGKQGLAHYGGNITYRIPVTTKGGGIAVTVPHFAGTAIRVEIDGQKGYIAYPPYRLALEGLRPGEHTLKLTLLGNRWNCFGPVHLADPQYRWLGPGCWRTEGSCWTESYRLKPLGILSAPMIEEIS